MKDTAYSFLELARLDPTLFLLVDAALKSVLLLILAGAAVLALRRASAAWRHSVWSCALIGLLALPTLSVILPQWSVALLPGPALVAAGPASATESESANRLSLPEGSGSRAKSHARPSTPPVPVFFPMARVSDLSSTPRLEFTHGKPPSNPLPLWPALVWSVWAFGVVAVWTPWVVGVLRVRRMRRLAQPICASAWQAMMATLAEQLGVLRPVTLLASTQTRVPLTWGVVRPLLLMPREVEAWSVERRRVVLLHELAHIQRWDCLTQALAQLACGLYWFNPLAWLAVFQIRAEQERACDDRVLNTGAKSSDYAEHLLQIATGARQRAQILASGIAMTGRSKLERRLRAILEPGRNRSAIGRRVLLALALVFLGLLVPMAMLRAGVAEAPRPVTAQPASAPARDQPAPARDAGSAFTVSGQVADDQGKPVAGAVIRAACGIGTLRPTGTAVTDASGGYTLHFGPGVRLGRASGSSGNRLGVGFQAATIQVSKPGYFEKNLGRQGNLAMTDMAEPWPDAANFAGVVQPSEPYQLDFVLAPAARIQGRLLDTIRRPMSKRSVSIEGKELPPSQNVLTSSETDDHGRFLFEAVPLGRAWWLSVQGAASSRPVSDPFMLNQPGNYTLSLTQADDGRLKIGVENGRLRHFVRLVLDQEGLSFEGRETSWDRLPGLLEKVPYCYETVLELALASDELTLREINEARSQAQVLAQRFGFEYLSEIGVHPWKSSGSPTLILPTAHPRESGRADFKEGRILTLTIEDREPNFRLGTNALTLAHLRQELAKQADNEPVVKLVLHADTPIARLFEAADAIAAAGLRISVVHTSAGHAADVAIRRILPDPLQLGPGWTSNLVVMVDPLSSPSEVGDSNESSASLLAHARELIARWGREAYAFAKYSYRPGESAGPQADTLRTYGVFLNRWRNPSDIGDDWGKDPATTAALALPKIGDEARFFQQHGLHNDIAFRRGKYLIVVEGAVPWGVLELQSLAQAIDKKLVDAKSRIAR